MACFYINTLVDQIWAKMKKSTVVSFMLSIKILSLILLSLFIMHHGQYS